MIDDIIELYTVTTGKQITDLMRPQYEAWIRRAIVDLEDRLGWSLSGFSNVDAIGTSRRGCDCDLNINDLDEPPRKRGTYRFFSFSTKQPFVHIDPFKKVHGVYFCRIIDTPIIDDNESEGDKVNVVVLKEITDYQPRYTSPRFGKYIKACHEMSVCQATCERSCTECTAILVDADWLTWDDVKDIFGALICDYVDWMANDGPANRGIRSESVDGHSVGYRDYAFVVPYTNPSDATIIATYAGPYGLISKKRIW